MRNQASVYGGRAAPEPFALASRYAHLGAGAGGSVREDHAEGASFLYSERHLQCVWLDPRLRPADLTTDEGETVMVDDPGIWNLEAGPDFLGAVLRLGPDQRRITGDVELHIQPSGWVQHGHADDPRYSGVRVHVTYFPTRGRHPRLPPGAIRITLKDQLAANPYFSFETIDLAAYPYAVRAVVPPCSEALSTWSPAEQRALLEAAGEERLRRKAERMKVSIQTHGPEQTVYEEVLCTLGYKHNKRPFRTLATRVPVADLRAESRGDARTAYAILAGVAGLLPDHPRPSWDEETRTFVRDLWDIWWKKKHPWASREMDRSAWRRSNLRPANHPLRRLMAAACIFTATPTLDTTWLQVARGFPAACLPRCAKQLTDVSDLYWNRRFSFGGRPLHDDVALVGPSRARAIMINVLVPFLAAAAEHAPFEAGVLRRLPRDGDNQVVRQAAHFLFGPDHSASLYRDGLRRQGLIQIFHDFCLNDRTRCAACALPSLLRGHRTRMGGL